MTYILLVILSVHNGISISGIEFDDLQSCEYAKKITMESKLYGWYGRSGVVECVRKGAE